MGKGEKVPGEIFINHQLELNPLSQFADYPRLLLPASWDSGEVWQGLVPGKVSLNNSPNYSCYFVKKSSTVTFNRIFPTLLFKKGLIFTLFSYILQYAIMG
jgi:hypothetical protein